VSSPDLGGASAAKLDTVASALEILRDEIAADKPLEAVLQRLVDTGVEAVTDADGVTVSVLTGTGPRTAAVSDEQYVRIDEEQYAAGRGPCWQAAHSRRPVRAVVDDEQDRWPEFAVAAEKCGVRAYLSVPVTLGQDEGTEEELIGAINLSSSNVSAFDPFDEQLMRLFTVAASAAISNARRWQFSRQQIQQLERALASRAEIDQAKGVLMAAHGITAEDAFARLVEQSQRHNTKLHDVARALLYSLRKR
jgi:GAF domain-containing protein